MNKIKQMFRSAQSRYGTYSTLLIVVVLAIVIVANMVAGQLPERWRNVDLSDNKLYEISAQSKDLLKKLDKEVEIHILSDKDSADERLRIFIEKYTALSSKVSVKWTDPVLHPTVLTENNAETGAVIISCAKTGKSRATSLSEMLYYDETQYYYYGKYVELFDAEGQLTSAINYVVNDVAQKIYYTTGHGETALSATLSELMEKSSFTTEELNTMLVEKIPEDCDLLILNAPTADLAESEIAMITSYMQAGGDVSFILSSEDKQLANIEALLGEYGIQVVSGYIAEQERYYAQLAETYGPYAIAPVLTLPDNMKNGIKTGTIMLLLARGMKLVDPARDTVTVEAFMSTSENAYAVTEAAQTQGTYVMGAIATEGEGRFTVISAASMVDEQLTSLFPSLENNTLFMNGVTANFDNVSNVAIEAKSLEMAQNTMQNVGLFTFIVVIGIPVLILILGFVNWLKRRKA